MSLSDDAEDTHKAPRTGDHDLLEAKRTGWIQIQLEVASQVVVLLDPITQPTQYDRFQALSAYDTTSSNHYFGGVDVSFPSIATDSAVAVYVVVDARTMQVVHQDFEFFALNVPYIPSFLAFREIDPLVRLVQKQQRERPDLRLAAILVDGNGILHPRRAGLACFLGTRTGVPTIGVGKTLFCEGGLSHDGVSHCIEESLQAAVASVVATSPAKDSVLVDWGECSKTTQSSSTAERRIDRNDLSAPVKANIGMLLQTLGPVCHGVAVPLHVHDDISGAVTRLAYALVGHGGRVRGRSKFTTGSKNPIFVSIGNAISLQEAVQICAFLSLARIPEPVRQADLIGRDLLRQLEKG